MQPAPSEQIASLSERLYRGLLRAYPRQFREGYAEPMAQLFRDTCRDTQRGRGTLGLLGLWLPTLGDLLKNALAEHLSAVSPELPESASRIVWAEPEADAEGAVSRDGRYLSYTDWGSAGNLAVHELASGEKRLLTHRDPSWAGSSEYAGYSIPSPDGKQIAYAWYNEELFYDLRVTGLDGSGERVLYRDKSVWYVEPRAWSPDGTRILAKLFGDETLRIGLVSIADGSVKVLRTLKFESFEAAGLWGTMCFSPDGRYIAYDTPPQGDSPARDIFLLSVDGGGETLLVEDDADCFVLAWSPDGRHVLFARDGGAGIEAHLIPVADGAPLGSAELVESDLGPSVFPLGITGDGTYYYGVGSELNDVYLAWLDPRTGRAGEPEKWVSDVAVNTAPEWSPDGRCLAYVTRPGSGHQLMRPLVLVIRSLETGRERQLPLEMGACGLLFQPRWSPDGRGFLVCGRDPEEREGVYYIDAGSGERSPILQEESTSPFTAAVWSPDGRTLVHRSFDTKSRTARLVAREVETGDELVLSPLAPGPPSTQGLCFSPDGTYLAFIETDPDRGAWTTLKAMPSSGGTARELLRVTEPESLAELAWTPDGRWLLFGRARGDPQLRREEPSFALWRISAEGGDPEPLGLAMDGLQLQGLRIHPDGRRLAFTAGGTAYRHEIRALRGVLP